MSIQTVLFEWNIKFTNDIYIFMKFKKRKQKKNRISIAYWLKFSK